MIAAGLPQLFTQVAFRAGESAGDVTHRLVEVVGDLLGLAEQGDRLRVDRLRVAGLVQPLAQPVQFGAQPGAFGVSGLDLVGQRALARLASHVSHFHLKNVSSRARLDVFAPANVYSAAGSRQGMVGLFEGAFDYRTFLADLAGDVRVEASLEWFGDDVHGTLSRDRSAIAQLGRWRRLTAWNQSDAR